MKKTSKKMLIVAVIVLLLALAIGYAAFSDTLKISGTANAKGTFDLKFIEGTLDSHKGITADGSGVTISPDFNTATVKTLNLAYPGAGAQYTVKIQNVGTIPAKLKAITPVGLNDSDIKVTFPELTEGEKGEVIQPSGTCTITFTVEWDKTSKLVGEKEVEFSLQLEYEQDTTAFTGAASHSDK